MSNVDSLREDVEQVKGQMVENIGKIIERGERLEDLDERTDTLRNRAGQFQVLGTQLKRKFWWQNFRLWIIVIVIIVVILLVIGAIIAGVVAGSLN